MALRVPIAEEEDTGTENSPDVTVADYDTDASAEYIADDDKVVINCGGTRHETRISTLSKRQGTRLSHLANKHVKGATKEYSFDRHPGVFNSVVDYYRSGELHVPLDVCGAVVMRELRFWKIDDGLVEPCCWISYSSYIDNQKTLSEFNLTVGEEEDTSILNNLQGWKKIQMTVWMILDHPRSSRLAMSYAVTSFLFVVASIAGFCLETLPHLHEIRVNFTHCDSDEEEDRDIQTWIPNAYLESLDHVCTAFFTIELVTRIVFAPNKAIFFKSPMNIIDILALLPLYVQIILDITDKFNCFKRHRAVIETIFILRIVRIFRVFHLVKHYKALKILVHAIKASIQELLMLSIFLFIAMLVFSTLIFYAEGAGQIHNSGQFGAIPVGFWWSIITMTTVGYGDVTPQTTAGCFIGVLCALCGVLLVALTIPVISNNFALFYMHARTRDQIAKRNKEKNTKKKKSSCRKTDPPPELTNKKRSPDSKALLTSIESVSTTDESGIMLTKHNEESIMNISPSDQYDKATKRRNEEIPLVILPTQRE